MTALAHERCAFAALVSNRSIALRLRWEDAHSVTQAAAREYWPSFGPLAIDADRVAVEP
ncbi:hypothetical protein BH10PSE17_BH10PSE17_01160 [soil metagenome]